MAQTLKWLQEKPGHDPPTAIVGKAWQRHVVRDDGRIDATDYSFCTRDKLRNAIRCRDVFINPSWRHADLRAGLLAGTEWEAARPIVCRSLELTAQPEPTLAALTRELDETYRRVAARLPENGYFVDRWGKTGNNRWYEEYVPWADKLYDDHLEQLRKVGQING